MGTSVETVLFLLAPTVPVWTEYRQSVAALDAGDDQKGLSFLKSNFVKWHVMNFIPRSQHLYHINIAGVLGCRKKIIKWSRLEDFFTYCWYLYFFIYFIYLSTTYNWRFSFQTSFTHYTYFIFHWSSYTWPNTSSQNYCTQAYQICRGLAAKDIVDNWWNIW